MSCKRIAALAIINRIFVNEARIDYRARVDLKFSYFPPRWLLYFKPFNGENAWRPSNTDSTLFNYVSQNEAYIDTNVISRQNVRTI